MNSRWRGIAFSYHPLVELGKSDTNHFIDSNHIDTNHITWQSYSETRTRNQKTTNPNDNATVAGSRRR
jgi:hypothetical protein